MPLEFTEIRFKNIGGNWVTIQIEDINEKWGPSLNLASNNSVKFNSLYEIPHFTEIAPHLKEFRLSSPIKEKIDLSIFKNLKKLYLNIPNTEIDKLETLTDLESFTIYKSRLKKIEGLPKLKKLYSIEISYSNLKKIPVIGKLQNLKYLNLSHNQISKIEGLDFLKNIYTLILSCNNISKIENLSNLKNLQNLNLDRNPISKIEKLENLKKLKSINLTGTKIKSLNGIEKLNELNILDISGTNVSSLEPLKKFKNIRYFRAISCPIRSLHGFNIDPNHITEFSVDPNYLCPTVADLLRNAYSRIDSLSFRRENINTEFFDSLFKFYAQSTTDLALHYINQHKPESSVKPLTDHETERLIHEATQKERTILEDAVAKKFLPIDDSVLFQINDRLSIDISGKKNMKILL